MSGPASGRRPAPTARQELDRPVVIALRARRLHTMRAQDLAIEESDAPVHTAVLTETGLSLLDRILLRKADERDRALAAVLNRLEDAYDHGRGAGRIVFEALGDALPAYDVDALPALAHALSQPARSHVRRLCHRDYLWVAYLRDSWPDVADALGAIRLVADDTNADWLELWRSLPSWLLPFLPEQYRPTPLFLETP